MPDVPIVEPAEPQAPAPEVAPAQPQEAAQGALPPDLLRLPFMHGLIAGSPAAVSVPIKAFSKLPEAELIAKSKDVLAQAGIGFYRSMNGDLGVIFNQLHIHPQDLQAADKMGKLAALAPPLTAVDHAISKSGLANPVLAAKGVPKGPPAPRAPVPTSASGGFSAPSTPSAAPAMAGRPPSAAVGQKLLTARLQNMNPGAPTSGATPGSGRILNEIMKPVV
jgi:hypothetical protein